MISFLKFFFPALFSIDFWRGAYYSFMLTEAASRKEESKVQYWKNKIDKFVSEDSGQAIAEFAAILPVFAFFCFMIVDIQWMTRTAAAIEYVVMETARCEAIQSGACAAPSSPQGYATTLAQNLRLSTDANLDLDTPPCTPNTCSVSIRYHYKALGAWFPALTISRTGSAAVPPAVTP